MHPEKCMDDIHLSGIKLHYNEQTKGAICCFNLTQIFAAWIIVIACWCFHKSFNLIPLFCLSTINYEDYFFMLLMLFFLFFYFSSTTTASSFSSSSSTVFFWQLLVACSTVFQLDVLETNVSQEVSQLLMLDTNKSLSVVC